MSMRTAPSIVAVALLLEGLASATAFRFDPPRVVSATAPTPVPTAADVNDDGHLDLAVGNHRDSTFRVYLGDGHLGFGPPIVSPTVGNPGVHSQALGDLDGDGVLDLGFISADHASRTTFMTGRGDGSFVHPGDRNARSGNVQGMSLGDFDGDGDLDAATGSDNGDRLLILWTNDGSGDLTESSTITDYHSPLRPNLVDVNGDGRLDLAFIERIGRNSMVVLLGQGDGTFVLGDREPLPAESNYPEVGDLDGDTHPDHVLPMLHEGSIRIVHGQPGGTLEPSLEIPLGGGFPYSVALADFDCDGDLDIAAGRLNTQDIVLLENRGGRRFERDMSLPTSTGDSALPSFLAVGDFDGDGGPDLAAGLEYKGQVWVFPNRSERCIAHPPTCQARAVPSSLAEGEEGSLDATASSDLDGDVVAIAWRQIAGAPVTLDLTQPFLPRFAAPQVARGGDTLTFRCTVTDSSGLSCESDPINVTVSNINHSPHAVAACPSPVEEGSRITVSAADSFDPDGDSLEFTWVDPPMALSDHRAGSPFGDVPIVGSSGDILRFVVDVSDGLASARATCDVVVENVNHAPVANAGPDTPSQEASVAQLDGGASSDVDGDVLVYEWEQVHGSPVVLLPGSDVIMPTFVTPVVAAGGEALGFRLTVTDAEGASSSDDVEVLVQNTNDPPTCSLARATPAALWPPNHALLPVGITGLSDPELDEVRVTILGVRQDEVGNGLGDGDTFPDAVVAGAGLLLRAERSGTGSGRTYHVAFRATDSLGQSCDGEVTVCVPRDRRGVSCGDEGASYSSW